jgi:hypothetical protein
LLRRSTEAQTPLDRFVADLSWTCCGFAVQLFVQQIHNESNKCMEFELISHRDKLQKETVNRHALSDAEIVDVIED